MLNSDSGRNVALLVSPRDERRSGMMSSSQTAASGSTARSSRRTPFSRRSKSAHHTGSVVKMELSQ